MVSRFKTITEYLKLPSLVAAIGLSLFAVSKDTSSKKPNLEITTYGFPDGEVIDSNELYGAKYLFRSISHLDSIVTDSTITYVGYFAQNDRDDLETSTFKYGDLTIKLGK